MRVRAVAKFVRVKPLMVRQVAREVRGQSATQMLTALQFKPGKGAFVLRKVIASAVANAEENHGLNSDSLRIAEIRVDEGPRQKRVMARAMGRANRILKRTAHITVVVEDDFEASAKTGPKPKARPTFAKVAGKKAKSAPVAAAAEEPKAEEVTEEVTEQVTEEVVETTTPETTADEAEGDAQK